MLFIHVCLQSICLTLRAWPDLVILTLIHPARLRRLLRVHLLAPLPAQARHGCCLAAPFGTDVNQEVPIRLYDLVDRLYPHLALASRHRAPTSSRSRGHHLKVPDHSCFVNDRY